MLSNAPTQITKSLETIGLDENHAKVYLANLELGKSPASAIAKNAKVPRSTVYGILNDLQKMGLVSSVKEETKTFFTPTEPSQLLKLAKDKLNDLTQSAAALEKMLPQLESIYNSNTPGMPKVRFYKGERGLRFALYDTLAAEESLWLCNGDVNTQLKLDDDPEYLKQYVEESVLRGQKTRELLQDTPATREYKEKFGSEKRQIILTPSNKTSKVSHVDKIIHGNKVTFISHDNLKAVIIEDETIAAAERETFETLWKYWSKRAD